MNPSDPIGFFDSGVGGLTVLRETVRLLPNENIIYLGDTARLPYGNKSPQAVLRYTLENASFLMARKIKFLIIACFTASTHGLEALEQHFSIPVIGVIQSGIEDLMAATQSKRVAILGTSSTIKSGILQTLIETRESDAVVFPVACPLLAPLIEEGFFAHPAAKMIAAHYLNFLKDHQIDSALLACTHYPLMRQIIQETLGNGVQLIEPAGNCAIKTRNWLEKHGLLNPQKTIGSHEFYATDDPEKFRRLTSLFFGSEIKQVQEIKS